MKRTRRYKIDGEAVDIPLRWDELARKDIEDYGPFLEQSPFFTPEGRPILLTIEDACPYAEMVDNDPASIDCGSCRHYHQFPGSLLGICKNPLRNKRALPKEQPTAGNSRRRQDEKTT